MNIRDRLPLRKKISIKVPDVVSPEGQNEINALLRNILLEHDPKSTWWNFFTDDTWDWRWVVTKGEYAGTIPTRISKMMHKVHKINLTPKQMSQIGNIARANSGGFNHVMDFTDKFNWCDGDFGDSGSCFWGDNNDARELMENNDFLAMRLYMNGCGFGRCWMLPDFPKDGAIAIFNSYPSNFKLITMARILATYLGYSYQPTCFYNNGACSDLLYINGGGYVVVPQSILGTIGSTYDFHVDRDIVAVAKIKINPHADQKS